LIDRLSFSVDRLSFSARLDSLLNRALGLLAVALLFAGALTFAWVPSGFDVPAGSAGYAVIGLALLAVAGAAIVIE